MNYIGKFISNFKDFYNEINAATLTGAIDVVVVRQEDGSLVSSPFHVRFGKMGVLRSREKVVDIEINGEPVDIHMKLGETGEAFFVEELEDGVEVSPQLGTSPLPSSVLLDKLPLFPSIDAEGGKDDFVNPVFINLEEATDLKTDDAEKVPVDENGKKGKDGEEGKDRKEGDEGTVAVTSAQIPQKERKMESAQVPEKERNVDNNSSEIGVIQLVKKSDKKKRDSFTQTSQSFTSSTPAKKEVDLPVTGKSVPNNITKSVEHPKQNTNLSEGQQGSKTDGEEVARVGKGSRRKRRKRYNNNKKNRPKSSGSQSSDDTTPIEVIDKSKLNLHQATQEGIFIMDDIESDKYVVRSSPPSPATPHMLQSASLPLLREAGRDETRTDEWEGGSLTRAAVGPDMHPFSDTDLSPPTSPSTSRPPTPIKSDTEYEVERQRTDSADGSSQTDDTKWQWAWGELPTPPPKTPTRTTPPSDSTTSSDNITGDKSSKKEEEDERSVLGSMLRFMRVTKKARHNPESEGIYLQDINFDELDPEVAALYFPRNFRAPGKSTGATTTKDEDAESGNGPSLPQSPHSVEGAIGGPKLSSDSDFEDSRHPIFDYKGYHDVAFSLCGHLNEYENDFPESLFLQSLVTYDDFCENPGLIQNPDLVVRIGGRYLNWPTAAPQLIALILFQRPLPPKVAEELSKEHMPKKEIRKRTESRGYSWFSSWRRNNQDEEDQGQNDTNNPNDSNNPKNNSEKSENTGTLTGENIDPNLIEVTAAQTQTSLPGTPRKQGGRRSTSGVGGTDSSESEEGEEGKERRLSGERFKKSLRLSSDQLAKLNLREGSNEALFSVTTAYQGTTRCKCHIFLWNYDTSIVVSDIDGTITKSDVLGHILPIIGKDWAQSGVAQLFTKIKNNGYNFLYLSARAIGQARITREYLRSIKQGDLSLPDGPLLLNPTSLVQAFHREVIEKKPEEFKISCLRDIQALYPSDCNPFYSGYGNKINDVWAYRAVGIPISRIFTINHRGELKHELTQTFQSSYSNLSDITNHMFPVTGQMEALAEYSSLQYWRPPLPDVANEIEALLAQVRGK